MKAGKNLFVCPVCWNSQYWAQVVLSSSWYTEYLLYLEDTFIALQHTHTLSWCCSATVYKVTHHVVLQYYTVQSPISVMMSNNILAELREYWWHKNLCLEMSCNKVSFPARMARTIFSRDLFRQVTVPMVKAVHRGSNIITIRHVSLPLL